jgi:LPS O-antigen subunit length determinant protein (WzzB/FepE family)
MPVARSDPRRATIIGIAGVVVGVVMIAVVLLANNLGGDRNTTQTSQS